MDLWDMVQHLPGAAAKNFGPALEKRRQEHQREAEERAKDVERQARARQQELQEIATQLLIEQRKEALAKGKEPEIPSQWQEVGATTFDQFLLNRPRLVEAEETARVRARETVEAEFPQNRRSGSGGGGSRDPRGGEAAPEALEDKLYGEATRMIQRGIEPNDVANWAARMDSPYRQLPRSQRLRAIQRAAGNLQARQTPGRGGAAGSPLDALSPEARARIQGARGSRPSQQTPQPTQPTAAGPPMLSPIRVDQRGLGMYVSEDAGAEVAALLSRGVPAPQVAEDQIRRMLTAGDPRWKVAATMRDAFPELQGSWTRDDVFRIEREIESAAGYDVPPVDPEEAGLWDRWEQLDSLRAGPGVSPIVPVTLPAATQRRIEQFRRGGGR